MNPYIFPAESGLATFAVNVGHGVESSQQHALFSRTAANVYSTLQSSSKEHRLPLSAIRTFIEILTQS